MSGQTLTYNADGTLASVYEIESKPPLNQSSFKMSNKAVAGDYTTNSIVPFSPDPAYVQKISLRWDSYQNLLQVKPNDNNAKSYIWGYYQAYPVAEAVNALVNDIFYTSFEEGDGNSEPGDSKTGARSKTDGFNASLSNLTNGYYTLSWWQKTGGSWTLQQNSVVVTNGTYNVLLGGQVDEVRFHPQAAMMTTYTYAPLVGMTSQCDAGNHVTYYEYDPYGRLSLIRDQDRNIVKKICYNYAGQPEQCN